MGDQDDGPVVVGGQPLVVVRRQPISDVDKVALQMIFKFRVHEHAAQFWDKKTRIKNVALLGGHV